MIYVYEEDLLIRDDITETLSAALPDEVCQLTSLADIGALRAATSSVFVVSLSRSDAEAHLGALVAGLPEKSVVLIAGDVAQETKDGVAVHLHKPFSAERLTQAVKSVLSAPQLSPQETS